MKKNYLTPEVELFDVQSTSALLTVSDDKLPVGPGHTDTGDDETVKDFVFEW